jgi:anti-sigma-K factor RskA
MIYDRPPERLASLADEYVVGTMSLRVRRRFERVLEASATARAAVRLAEDRFAALDRRLAPVPPSPATWDQVRARLGFADEPRQETPVAEPRWFERWRPAFAVMAAVVVLGLGWLVLRETRVETRPVASLRVDGGVELWAVELDRDSTRLAVRASRAVQAAAGKSYELWALPEGAAPVSLGLLPVRGAVERSLAPAQRAALAGARQVAVSLEPAGGSPTGAPTGPVLYVAELGRVSG